MACSCMKHWAPMCLLFVGVESPQNISICLDVLVAAHEASPCGVDGGMCRRQADAGVVAWTAESRFMGQTKSLPYG